MAAQYRNIFMGLRKPSDLCLLVSVPMRMYRIKTLAFTSGLDFFEKAVLRLCYFPGMTGSKIAGLLNIEESLIDRVISKLEDKELLDNGQLTDKGIKMRDDANGYVIDDTKTQIGYVFSYDNGEALFPYYQQKVDFASVDERDLVFNTERGEQKIGKPVEIKVANDDDGEIASPSEEQILRLIHNTSVVERLEKYSSETTSVSEQGFFNVGYIPNDTPEFVNVCTYVYLPQLENGLYEDDWQVLNPFGKGNSYELKLYLERVSKEDTLLNTYLLEAFDRVDTEGRRMYLEAQRWIKEKTRSRIDSTFGGGFELLPASVKGVTESVVEYCIRLEESGYDSVNNILNLFVNMQKALENILLTDQEERNLVYADLYNNLGNPQNISYPAEEYARFSKWEKAQIKRQQAEEKERIIQERKEVLRRVFKKMWLSDTSKVPYVLELKADRLNGKSLLDYLMRFVLSLAYEQNRNECGLLNVFKGRINDIVEIADIRNSVGHGGRTYRQITKENLDPLYKVFENIITDYIKYISNGKEKI